MQRRKYTVNCAFCEKPFHPERRTQECCSHGCANYLRDYRKRMQQGYSRRLSRVCPFCQKPFFTRQNKQSCCSKYCAAKLKAQIRHRSPDAIQKHFFSKVHVPEEKSQCWEWMAYRNEKGYGTFYLKGKWTRAHRAAFIIFKGPIEENLYVLHSCHNPACVNPGHLRLGTNADNMQDKVLAKRHTFGESHPPAKLNEQQVREIRAIREQTGEPYKYIADRFGITEAHAEHICKRMKWKHI